MVKQRGPVVNTYRLQLHPGFTFSDAADLAPYLADLGVTHLYLSPITMAAPGSTHGYDVIDPTRLNPELGGDEGFDRLVEAAHSADLGLIVDIVPNHMGIAPQAGNERWRDVLRNGTDSPHANIFDIDWSATEDGRARVVLPVLGDSVEAVVVRDEVTVDEASGDLVYFDSRFPLAPESLEWWRGLATRDRTALRELMDRQHYRLDYWRTGKRLTNYRRFFEVDDLIGVRVEDYEVHAVMHERVMALAQAGTIDGLRVDHPDGLRDPEEYLRRLQAEAPEGAYVVVEKILSEDEPLPPDWEAHGTTGYEVMNDFTRVLVDPRTEDAFTSTYAALTGESATFEEIADGCLEDVLNGSLSEQYLRLGRQLHEAVGEGVEQDEFLEAFTRLLARFPVYRTYHAANRLDPRAVEVVGIALLRAGVGRPLAALDVVADALAAPPEGAAREVVIRLQQIMPAIQAKGLEDRAFYRYRRLLALNEVGGDPGAFGAPVEAFHERLTEGARHWPRRMLTTATHDHKRGEDARARLAALSEFPTKWHGAASEAIEALRSLEGAVQAHASDLYLVLQTALATLPLGMSSTRSDPDPASRVAEYIVKALREAGERTAWLDPDEAYEEALAALTREAFGSRGSAVLDALAGLAEEVARQGAINGMAQLVLKLGAPGVVDTYQGNELWDLSLVDPDNRRPPDYTASRRILDSFADVLIEGDAGNEDRRSLSRTVLAGWRDGRIKMLVLALGLRARRQHPDVFLDGAYQPIEVGGQQAAHVIAFARESPRATAIVVVPRLSRGLNAASGDTLWEPSWVDTELRLSPAPGETRTGADWTNVLTGERHPVASDIPVHGLLGTFPVAILLREH